MKRILTIELDYNAGSIHGGDNDQEAKDWFENEVLGGPLILYSNEIGEEVGSVRVIENPFRAENARIRSASRRLVGWDYCHNSHDGWMGKCEVGEGKYVRRDELEAALASSSPESGEERSLWVDATTKTPELESPNCSVSVPFVRADGEQSYGYRYFGVLNETNENLWFDELKRKNVSDVTHWLPLPEPPEPAEEQKL